jgi:hypothetical protein
MQHHPRVDEVAVRSTTDARLSYPLSEACERNRDPILALIKPLLRDRQRVIEIGAGTGQHARHFAQQLPHLCWQASDAGLSSLPLLSDLATYLAHPNLPNLPPPLLLDVMQQPWPTAVLQYQADAAYSANTLHIMSWTAVAPLFAGLGRWLPMAAPFIVYGPFRYAGRHTSDSNQRFDRSLRQRDPASGVRDIESVMETAVANGFVLEADHAMPANNRTLVFRRQA